MRTLRSYNLKFSNYVLKRVIRTQFPLLQADLSGRKILYGF